MQHSHILLLITQYYMVFSIMDGEQDPFERAIPNIINQIFGGFGDFGGFGRLEKHGPKLSQSFPMPDDHDCSADMHKFCRAVVHECKGVFDCSAQCLTDHVPKLSTACQKSHPCAQDIDNHCSKIRGGEDLMMNCLFSFQEKLSEKCLKIHPCLKSEAGCEKTKYVHEEVLIQEPKVVKSLPQIAMLEKLFAPRKPIELNLADHQASKKELATLDKIAREKIKLDSEANTIESLRNSVARAKQKNRYLVAKEQNAEVKLKLLSRTQQLIKEGVAELGNAKKKKLNLPMKNNGNMNLIQQNDRLKAQLHDKQSQLKKYMVFHQNSVSSLYVNHSWINAFFTLMFFIGIFW